MDYIGISVFIVSIAICVAIFFFVRILISMNQSIKILNEVIEKTKVTMDEANGILKVANQFTQDIQKLTQNVKDIADTFEGALSMLKTVAGFTKKFKGKPKDDE